MQEVAWLSCLRGEWLLVTGDAQRHIRKWVDRDLALRDLSDEGWTIIRSKGRIPGSRRDHGMRFSGVCLRRTIH